MKRGRIALWSTASMAPIVCLAWALGLFLLEVSRQQQLTLSDSVIYLDQGWSQADREMFYQISQGSASHRVRHLPESGGCR